MPSLFGSDQILLIQAREGYRLLRIGLIVAFFDHSIDTIQFLFEVLPSEHVRRINLAYVLMHLQLCNYAHLNYRIYQQYKYLDDC